MSWSLIYLHGIEPVPWRNGGGMTRELLAWPGRDDWNVRISVAEVTQDGVFSNFPGVQRWFAVLSGAGVRLRVAAEVHELTAQSAPLQFDGGAPVHCTLVAGATRDFNLMLRKGNARLERVQGERHSSCACGTLVAAYSHNIGATLRQGDHSINLPPDTLAWRILDSDGLIELIAEDALWMGTLP